MVGVRASPSPCGGLQSAVSADGVILGSFVVYGNDLHFCFGFGCEHGNSIEHTIFFSGWLIKTKLLLLLHQHFSKIKAGVTASLD